MLRFPSGFMASSSDASRNPSLLIGSAYRVLHSSTSLPSANVGCPSIMTVVRPAFSILSGTSLPDVLPRYPISSFLPSKNVSVNSGLASRNSLV